MSIKFSVFIPVYFKEVPSYFDDCLKSMYDQTHQADELLVIKDGPLTIELDDVIEKWRKKFSEKLTVLSLEKNIGMSLALNEALKRCKYEWIARMDSDDIASPDRFEKQLKYIQENPEVDVFGSYIEEYDDEMKNFIAIRKVPTTDSEIKEYAFYRNPINHMTVMFKKRCAEEVGGYPSGFSTSDDYAFWIHMIMKKFIFGNIDESLVKARTGNGFLDRRHGVNYLKYELIFLQHLYKIKFYSFTQYSINLITRSSARLLPKSVLYYIYLLLRKK